MCGICGIYNTGSDNPVNKKELIFMRDLMHHRGPDSDGCFFAENLGLGIRRLKVIDLATGDQPIFNEDRSIAVVLNGEIYNYREIRKELEEKGHRFYTKSDTEVLAHLYEEKGESFVKTLNGIFAIALWDNQNKELFIARDQLGVKPLYYYYNGKRLIFASEIKSILAARDIASEIDRVSLDLYLSIGYVPGERTIFSGIKRLPPGSIIKFSNGKFCIEKYWDIEFKPQWPLSENDATEILLQKIRQAVSRQLVADVPLGVFLSGGIDSSLLVALMSTLVTNTIKTYNVSFSDSEGFSESDFALCVSNRFKTHHRQINMGPDACKILPKLIWFQDEPLADQAIIPTYLVSKLSREDVTVVLTGEGGDELFAGYGQYDRSAIEWKMNLLSRFPSWFIRFLTNKYSQADENFKGRLLFTRYAPYAKEHFAKRYLRTSQVIFTESDKESLYSRSMLNSQKNFFEDNDIKYYYDKIYDYDALSQMQYMDLKCYLPEDLLMKVDKMSMAVSLEARVPYLDKDVVEFVARLPPQMKFKEGTHKYILKKLAAVFLPDEISLRVKRGFDVPVSQWLRGELKDFVWEYLSKRNIERDGFFNSAWVTKMLEGHISGRHDYGAQIWAILVFSLWKKIFIDGEDI